MPWNKMEAFAMRSWARDEGREALKAGQCSQEVTICWLIIHRDSQASVLSEIDFWRLHGRLWGWQVNLGSKASIIWLYLRYIFQGFKDGHSIPPAKVRQQRMVIQGANSAARLPEFHSQLCCVTLGK